MELSDKLSEPIKMWDFHGDAVVGATTTHSEPQFLTVAKYGMGEFWVYKVKVDLGREIPTLEKHLIISNSPKASWQGEAISAQLWNEHQPRAQVGQVSNDGKELLYLANAGMSIGRISLPSASDVKPEVKLPLAGIAGDRAEYFLQLRDGNLAVIENYDNCLLSLYHPVKNHLTWQDGTNLGGSLFYGLAQDNDNELMMVVPKKGNYPLESNKEPGVYRVSLAGEVPGEPEKDPRFDAIELPADIRGLAPVFHEGKVHGYFLTTYKATRGRLNGGDPSELFYAKVSNNPKL